MVKTRQLGVTQVIMAWMLYKAIQNPAWVCAIFCRGLTEVAGLNRRMKQLILTAQIPTQIDNVGLIKLANGAEIHFRNSAREGLRSLDSVAAILWDEAAFLPRIGEIYSASAASTSTVANAKQIIVSTPSAKSGWFWERINAQGDIEEICENIRQGRLPGYYAIADGSSARVVIHWKTHPVFSLQENYLEWRREQEGCDEETLQREHNLKFIDSSVTVFTAEIVKQCAITDEMESYPSSLDEMNEIYVAGLDVSSTGEDYTVLSIWKWNQTDDILILVHLYRQRKKTAEYHLFNIVQLLENTNCILAVEINSIGQFYFEQLSTQLLNTNIIPIRTTAQSKPVMISALQLRMETQRILFNEKSPLVSELLNFQRQGEKLTAPIGQHDDCVMSCAIAVAAVNKLNLNR